MNLRDYLHFKKMTLNELSEKLGISPNHLGAIKRLETPPSKQLAKFIEKLTDGEVLATELMNQKYKKKLKKNGIRSPKSSKKT